ncbi:hypothetical protein MPTA5024_02085 [Microbispora sp. ATCC PTA-5024]|nr:hypothetical protein MPTA5024_02085 [Microbispora sp. ATCC PTA-5024]
MTAASAFDAPTAVRKSTWHWYPPGTARVTRSAVTPYVYPFSSRRTVLSLEPDQPPRVWTATSRAATPARSGTRTTRPQASTVCADRGRFSITTPLPPVSGWGTGWRAGPLRGRHPRKARFAHSRASWGPRSPASSSVAPDGVTWRLHQARAAAASILSMVSGTPPGGRPYPDTAPYVADENARTARSRGWAASRRASTRRRATSRDTSPGSSAGTVTASARKLSAASALLIGAVTVRLAASTVASAVSAAP